MQQELGTEKTCRRECKNTLLYAYYIFILPAVGGGGAAALLK